MTIWTRLSQLRRPLFRDTYPRIVFAWFKLRVGEGFIVARKDGRVVGYLISEVRKGRGHMRRWPLQPIAGGWGLERPWRENLSTALVEESNKYTWRSVP